MGQNVALRCDTLSPAQPANPSFSAILLHFLPWKLAC